MGFLDSFNKSLNDGREHEQEKRESSRYLGASETKKEKRAEFENMSDSELG